MPETGRELTSRQREVLDLLTHEAHTVREVAEIIGTSTGNVYKHLEKDHVKEELYRRTRDTLSQSSLQAAKTLGRLANSAKSETVQMEAAKAIIDRSGVVKSTEKSSAVAIQINLNSGDV